MNDDILWYLSKETLAIIENELSDCLALEPHDEGDDERIHTAISDIQMVFNRI